MDPRKKKVYADSVDKKLKESNTSHSNSSALHKLHRYVHHYLAIDPRNRVLDRQIDAESGELEFVLPKQAVELVEGAVEEVLAMKNGTTTNSNSTIIGKKLGSDSEAPVNFFSFFELLLSTSEQEKSG